MRLALPPISCKVPTPPDLARAIVASVGDTPESVWLEPSHGTGVFLRAIAELGVPRSRLTAVDLDPKESPSDSLAQTYRGKDFLRWSASTNQRFDRIVGNPPYVSIKRLKPSLRMSASSVADMNGNAIGAGANVWYAFVLASMNVLRSGGTLAFVLPSAAEFANYSAALRKSIGGVFGSIELYRSSKSLFENVQEGTLVAIARDYMQTPGTFGKKLFGSKSRLIKGLCDSASISQKECNVPATRAAKRTHKFSSIASIRLGGVTGDASFFLMNDERRKELGLPVRAMTPVLSKAKHLRSADVDRTAWTELKDGGERVWLFNPTGATLENANVKDYLSLKHEKGGCNRAAYKISARAPWYQTPLPETIDAFVSGMCQDGPRLTINEMNELSATNTLYVVTFNSRDQNDWYRYATALCTSSARRQVRKLGRRYADGLIKFEPGTIGAIELPQLADGLDYHAIYQNVVETMRQSGQRDASEIADSAIS